MKKLLRWWKRDKGHRYINGGKGVISILLVGVMVPFTIFADLLVESARYHSATTILDEAMDSSALSTLADYDKYLYDRFGLLALDNSVDVGKKYTDYLKKNTDSLGAWNLSDITASGEYSLEDTEILEKQIAEFCQYSAPVALTNDFALSELIAQLEKLTNVTSIMDTITKTGKMMDAIVVSTKSLEDLKKAAQELENKISEYETAYTNSFERKFNELVSVCQSFKEKQQNLKNIEKEINEFEKVNDVKDKIDEIENEKEELGKKKETGEISEEEYKSLTDEKDEQLTELNKELEEALKENEELIKRYKQAEEEVKAEKTKVENAKTELKTAKDEYNNKINALKSAMESYRTKAEAAKTAAEAIITSTVDLAVDLSKNSQEINDANQKKKELEEKKNDTTISEDERKEYEESIAEIDNKISDINAANSAIEAGGNAAKNTATAHANEIKDTLNKYNTEAINDYLSKFRIIQNNLENLDTDQISADSVLDRNKYYVEINKNFISSNEVQILMESLAEKLVGGNLWDRLKGFGTVLRSVFTTNLFFDTRLNAYIADNSGYSGGDADTVLQDISGLIEAIDKLHDPIGLMFITSTLKNIYDKFITLMKDLINLLTGIVTRAGKSLSNILSNQCGSKILLDEYLLKTMSNRTDMTTSGAMGGTNELTGYSFANVKYAKSDHQVPDITGISTLIELFKDIKNGGNDVMFNGAEAEYIITGSRSEVVNQTNVFMSIFFIRMMLDFKSILGNPEVQAIATGTGIGAPVVNAFYIVIEPFIDTIFIVNNKEIPVIKSTVYLTPTGSTKLVDNLIALGLNKENEEKVKEGTEKIINDVAEEHNGSGYSAPAGDQKKKSDSKINWGYEKYLFLLMMVFVDNQTAVGRFQNIVNLESKAYYSYYGKEEFKMDKTYTCIKGTVKGEFDPVLPLGNLAVNGIFNQKRSRMRGY